MGLLKDMSVPRNEGAEAPSLRPLGQIADNRMSVLVVHLQTIFPGQQHLLGIARLSQRLGLHVTQGLERDVIKVEQVGRVLRAEEAIWHDLQATEVGHIEVERGVQLVAVGLLETGGVAGEGRDDHLIRGTNQQDAGRATGRISRLHGRLDQRFSQRSGGARHRGGIAGRDRERTRTGTHRTLSDPASQTSSLASRARRTSVERLVADQSDFRITLQLFHLLHLLERNFGLAASLVDHLFGVRDDEVLVADLRVVAPTGAGSNGGERTDVVTFQLRVVSRSSKGIRLPLEETSDTLGLLQGRIQRRLGGRNDVDDIRQILTLTDGGVRGVGICNDGHD